MALLQRDNFSSDKNPEEPKSFGKILREGGLFGPMRKPTLPEKKPSKSFDKQDLSEKKIPWDKSASVFFNVKEMAGDQRRGPQSDKYYYEKDIKEISNYFEKVKDRYGWKSSSKENIDAASKFIGGKGTTEAYVKEELKKELKRPPTPTEIGKRQQRNKEYAALWDKWSNSKK